MILVWLLFGSIIRRYAKRNYFFIFCIDNSEWNQKYFFLPQKMYNYWSLYNFHKSQIELYFTTGFGPSFCDIWGFKSEGVWVRRFKKSKEFLEEESKIQNKNDLTKLTKPPFFALQNLSLYFPVPYNDLCTFGLCHLRNQNKRLFIDAFSLSVHNSLYRNHILWIRHFFRCPFSSLSKSLYINRLNIFFSYLHLT